MLTHVGTAVMSTAVAWYSKCKINRELSKRRTSERYIR